VAEVVVPILRPLESSKAPPLIVTVELNRVCAPVTVRAVLYKLAVPGTAAVFECVKLPALRKKFVLLNVAVPARAPVVLKSRFPLYIFRPVLMSVIIPPVTFRLLVVILDCCVENISPTLVDS
jgi:hypothetical protein